MGLIQGKGEPIPEVPRVKMALQYENGPAEVEVYGDIEFYLLVCGHRIETCNADPLDMAFNAIPCRRCWEALLGTEDVE